MFIDTWDPDLPHVYFVECLSQKMEWEACTANRQTSLPGTPGHKNKYLRTRGSKHIHIHLPQRGGVFIDLSGAHFWVDMHQDCNGYEPGSSCRKDHSLSGLPSLSFNLPFQLFLVVPSWKQKIKPLFTTLITPSHLSQLVCHYLNVK